MRSLAVGRGRTISIDINKVLGRYNYVYMRANNWRRGSKLITGAAALAIALHVHVHVHVYAHMRVELVLGSAPAWPRARSLAPACLRLYSSRYS